jgi:hypothetical protein
MPGEKNMKSKIILLILLAVSIATMSAAKPSRSIREAVLSAVKLYPKLEMQDLYKIAYQAAMGNEHLITDSAQTLSDLEKELASISGSSEEPLMEIITSDSSIVRINLRPFKARHGDGRQLFAAMMNTTREFRPAIFMLRQYWLEIEALAAAKKIPFDLKELHKFFATMEEQKLPSVNHSKIFEATYHPSYRIIAKPFFQSFL